jgi:hypothetical protein
MPSDDDLGPFRVGNHSPINIWHDPTGQHGSGSGEQVAMTTAPEWAARLVRAANLVDQIQQVPELAAVVDELAAIRAGAEKPGVEAWGRELSPAQLWWTLLDEPVDRRMKHLASVLDASRAGAVCVLGDHAGRIEELQDTVERLRLQAMAARAERDNLLAVIHQHGGPGDPAQNEATVAWLQERLGAEPEATGQDPLVPIGPEVAAKMLGATAEQACDHGILRGMMVCPVCDPKKQAEYEASARASAASHTDGQPHPYVWHPGDPPPPPMVSVLHDGTDGENTSVYLCRSLAMRDTWSWREEPDQAYDGGGSPWEQACQLARGPLVHVPGGDL